MGVLKTRGRPRSRDPKSRVCAVRLNEEDMKKLIYTCEKLGESSSDALREGLRMRYNLARNSG